MSLLPFSRNGHSRDGTSRSGSLDSYPRNAAVQNGSVSSQAAADPLTLRQALTITAGLAGLVGLLGGGLVRFSLANSSNTRFLSPLQTFPALSDWPSAETSQPPEGASDPPLPETTDVFPFEEEAAPLEEDTWQNDLLETEPWDGDSELNWQTSEDDFDTFRSERFTSTPAAITEPGRSAAPSTFDAFANRSAARSRPGEDDDPLEALSKGPLLRQNALDEPYEAERERSQSF